MTDILLLFLAPLGGYLMSVLIVKRPKSKESLWFGLYAFCNELRNNVRYEKTALTFFAKDFIDRHQELYACDAIKAYMVECNTDKLKLPIKGDEQQNIDRFFSRLYAPNADALLQHIDYFSTIFKEYADSQRQGNAKTLPLYHKLGVLCGIVVALLLM